MTELEEQSIEGIRLGQGTVGSEVAKAIYRDILDIKSMISAIMAQSKDGSEDIVTSLLERSEEMAKEISDLRSMVTSLLASTEISATTLSMVTATANSIDKLRSACQLMSAKVDSTATPVSPFTGTFVENV